MDFRELIEFKERENMHLRFSQDMMETMEHLFGSKEKMSPFANQRKRDFIERQKPPRVGAKIHFQGDISLSILGGWNGYSNPRKHLDISEYISLELAILDMTESEPIDGYIDISKDSRFHDFKSKMILSEYFEGMVYTYVPVSLIQELFEYMVSKLGLITLG